MGDNLKSEVGTDPFPDARPAEEVIAEALARYCHCSCHAVIQPGLVPCPNCDLSSRSVAPGDA